MKKYNTVLTIAGSDCSGGAGIQADIKTIMANGGYAASVITALTAQNTQGVQSIFPVSSEFITAQLESIFSDIDIASIKIGMLLDSNVIRKVAEYLGNLVVPYCVIDPVMLAKHGEPLLAHDAIIELMKLLPLATLITPNLPEAALLLGMKINSKDKMSVAAETLAQQYQTNCLIKGGHLDGEYSSDYLYLIEAGKGEWFSEKRIETKHTHGTGCSLSSAIATYLARGYSMIEAVARAKNYVARAIASGASYQLGQGIGPIDHALDFNCNSSCFAAADA